MSVGNNLMSFFQAPQASKNPFDPQAIQQGQQPQQQQQQQPQAPQPPQANAQPQPAQPAQNPEQPLDGFTSLFKNDPQKQAENPQDIFNKPITQADFDALQKTVDSASFVQLNPELAQKALQGDLQSLQQLLESSSRSAFMQAARFSHGLVEQGLKTYHSRLDGVLPARFQDLQSRSHIEQSIPAFQHEAARPVIDALRQQILQSNPNATPQQVQEKLVNYLKALTPQEPQQQQVARNPLTGQPMPGNGGEQPAAWDKFFRG